MSKGKNAAKAGRSAGKPKTDVSARIAAAATDDEALDIAIADADAARAAAAKAEAARAAAAASAKDKATSGAGVSGGKDLTTTPTASSKPHYLHVLRMNPDGTTTPVATDIILPDGTKSTEERYARLITESLGSLALTTDGSAPKPTGDIGSHLAKLLASRATTESAAPEESSLVLGPHTKAILDSKIAASEDSPGRK